MIHSAEGHGSLSETLAPLAERMRQSISNVRAVSQVLITIPTNNIDLSFSQVRDEVLRWMERRAGRHLPEEAWAGQSFELAEVGAQRAEASFIESTPYWACRLDDSDKSMPQRTWVSEAAIARREGFLRFGARLFCVTRGRYEPFVPSIPVFVRQIVEKNGGVIDGRSIGDAPWIVDNAEKADKLVSLIVNPQRTLDVFVVSTQDRPDDLTTVVSAENLFRRTMGAAHVAVVTAPAAYALTDQLGKEFSVFRHAVRTYRPGFNLDESQPSDHPLALGHRIAEWNGGPAAFEDFLIEQCLRATVSSKDLEDRLPPYTRVKQVAQELRRKARSEAGASDKELLDLALTENDNLKKQAAEDAQTYEGLVEAAENERAQVISANEEAKSQIRSLRARIEHLEQLVSKSKLASTKTPIPNNFNDLENWARVELAGKIVIHNRAIRAAKKSPFKDVALAYRALLIMRDHYVPMRRRGGDALRTAYEKALASENLTDESSFAGNRANEQGETYFVEFDGRRRVLDRHLKGSNSRDPRYGFRLYFFWDDENEQVVVGSLPNHLKTRAS